MSPYEALESIKAAQMRMRQRWQQYDTYMRWYTADKMRDRLTYSDEDPEVDDAPTLEVNFTYAWIDTMTSSVVPMNPQITLNVRNPDAKEMGQRREQLANDSLRVTKTGKRLKRASAHASMNGYGIVKTTWDLRRRRPRRQVVFPRQFVWDESVEDWDDIAWCAEALLLRKEDFEARSKEKRTPAGQMTPPRYNPRVAEKATYGSKNALVKGNSAYLDVGDWERSARGQKYVLVWEFYDFTTDTMYHLLHGCQEPLLETDLPYQYFRNPYDIIVFNDNLEDSTGLSDIRLIEEKQERLNELDTLELMHIQSQMPITFINDAAFDNPEEVHDSIRTASGPGAIAHGKLKNNARPSDAFFPLPTPGLQPVWPAVRQRVESGIEFELALPQFMRGGTGNVDIATEAMLADAGVRNRLGARELVIKDTIAELARKDVALWAEMGDPRMPIPVRVQGTKDTELLDYDDLGFDDPESFEQEWWFEYEAAPYSPTENSAAVQLQKLQQFMPILAQNPNVDNGKLIAKLLELLKMPDLYTDEPAAPMAMPGQPGAPGMSGMAGTDGPLPPEMMAQLQALQGEAPMNPNADVPPALPNFPTGG